jgi:hypothetical protein
VILLDLGIDQLAPEGFEGGKRAFLIRADEARVTDHVGGKDGSQTALGALFPHVLNS